MKQRQLGKSNIYVAPLAFGGNVFGWTLDEQKSFGLLDAFVNSGFNLIDTADVYSRWAPGNHGGESETIIGKWMKQRGNRHTVIIATKAGGDMGQGKRDLSAGHIRKAVENSLRRLQTDYIDLYQSHYDDPDTPMEETLHTYMQLVEEGKVRIIGASNFTKERLEQSLQVSKKNDWPLYQTLQPLYNLYDREVFEKELEPFCLENSIGVLNYYALASGFLSGKYRSEADLTKSARGAGNKKFLNERGFAILAALDEVAARHQSAPATIALAWLLTRPAVTAPIASATDTEQLKTLVRATEIKLENESVELLNKASDW